MLSGRWFPMFTMADSFALPVDTRFVLTILNSNAIALNAMTMIASVSKKIRVQLNPSRAV
jgi:hypothetical protein